MFVAGSWRDGKDHLVSSYDIYRPSAEWFRHDPYGIHGIGHAARVLVWVNWIGQHWPEAEGKVDIQVVRLAAAVHDVGRVSDEVDSGHGRRSAEWLKQNREKLPFVVDDRAFNKIVQCCVWHNVADANIPDMFPELKCIKDADGLDRVRINDLNPGFLRTETARNLIYNVWELYHITRLDPDPWAAVGKILQKRNWWIE